MSCCRGLCRSRAREDLIPQCFRLAEHCMCIIVETPSYPCMRGSHALFLMRNLILLIVFKNVVNVVSMQTTKKNVGVVCRRDHVVLHRGELRHRGCAKNKGHVKVETTFMGGPSSTLPSFQRPSLLSWRWSPIMKKVPAGITISAIERLSRYSSGT